MQNQEVTSPTVVVTNENSCNELDNIKQIECQVGEIVINGSCKPFKRSEVSPGTKTKRKAKSTRRRLNALMNNTSLHFSDTDSEGELSTPRITNPNNQIKMILKSTNENNHLHPLISVTLEGSDDSSYGGERRTSFVDNLTDVDEIYTSEPENNSGLERRKSIGTSPRGSLTVGDNPLLGETDLEDLSVEDDDVHAPIYVRRRSDILCDFNGETITTKEGDGPFSVEIRNQMSVNKIRANSITPDISIQPTTDSEDMEATDDDEEEDRAPGKHDLCASFDVLAASQIVMKNVDKMENLLPVKEPDDAISDGHTDVEDFE